LYHARTIVGKDHGDPERLRSTAIAPEISGRNSLPHNADGIPANAMNDGTEIATDIAEYRAPWRVIPRSSDHEQGYLT
jgi:hypothetical protein